MLHLTVVGTAAEGGINPVSLLYGVIRPDRINIFVMLHLRCRVPDTSINISVILHLRPPKSTKTIMGNMEVMA